MNISSRKYKGYIIDSHYDGYSLDARIAVWRNNKIVKTFVVDAGKRLSGLIQARQWVDSQIIVIKVQERLN